MSPDSSVGPSLPENEGLAQELAHHHLHATVEDAEDDEVATTTPAPKLAPVPASTPTSPENGQHENGTAPTWVPSPSANAVGKQPAASSTPTLDTQSHDLFPELAPPKSNVINAGSIAPTWGVMNNLGKTNDIPTPASNGASHPSTPAARGPSVNPSQRIPMMIPGRQVESVTLEPQFILPRHQLKRPIPDIIKDLNRKSRATVTVGPGANGRLKFEATGPQEVAQQALKDLVQQIGVKTSVKVPIPRSARAFVIGRGGSTIKHLQEKTGAKIHLPKAEDSAADGEDDDDDATIDVIVEGNALSAASAQNEILKIAGERSANTNTKLRGIPAEFYPFIAGPRTCHQKSMESNFGIQMSIPAHQAWSAQKPPDVPAPGGRPVFTSGINDRPIQLAGDRASVHRARAEIERRVQELRAQLWLQQLSIQRGRHQFIIGDQGIPVDDFFEETGCAILLPVDEEEDVVTIIGTPEQVNVGLEKAMDLAMNMQCSNIDIARFHRTAPGGGASIHARNVTRYLRHRKEIERLEKEYNTHINTPFSRDGALPWELFSRDGKNAIRAQSEISGIISGHPPERMSTVLVDPFYFQHLRNNVSARVQSLFGVQVVVPEQTEHDMGVLLIYEGAMSPDTPYILPRVPPTTEDIQAIKHGLEQAEKHIVTLISKQEKVTVTTMDVPIRYHEKLRKYIKKEQENRDPDQIPVRVSATGMTVTLRGPASAVENLAAKVTVFLEQETADEKERDHITIFEFPQKMTNQLIGKGGSHVKELRDKFDVEIQVQDGKVELKGPKGKAAVAKSHILALGRTWADETTHVLKIDPKFHRELIGAQGSQINRLQTRYKVLIFFPRTAKPSGDEHTNGGDAANEANKARHAQAADEVMIRGPKKGADEARDELFSLYQYYQENSHLATVAMPRKHVPMLIGSGGSALEEMRLATGARIEIPNARDGESVDIQVKGTKAQVAAAKKLLEEKKVVFDDTITTEIEVAKKHHKALIGANGSSLKELVVSAGGPVGWRELSRTIQFPKADSEGNMIKLEGRTEVVNKIVDRIKEIVAERDSQVQEVVEVPVEKHRMLVGRGGDIKRRLESQFSVVIDIPRQGDGRTGVKVIGRPEAVEKAKEHIMGMMKEQHGETIQVPRRLHHAISGSGQLFRKLRNEYHVNIDHAGHSTPQSHAQPGRSNGESLPLISDDGATGTAAGAHSWYVVDQSTSEEGDIPWVLRGSVENVAQAKKIVVAAIDQGGKNGCVGYLGLPDPNTYRLIVGPSGNTVKAIRQQSGCNITVPRDQTGQEAVEIAGTREGVEIAKDLILAAVRDAVDRSRE